ncbi:hypothetical protein Alches_13650 [Alicyclobacillus hesperidum subsp. aegles]|uniref:DUF2140 family protein n=1 Tax=Alicyclobacillus hesperidum TaxID=89784 RepID=UPI0007190E1E|nr:DUF2140 family protein [Alicyclobacillus hesperidum]KRW91281.1 hypothetical protein SD51_10025 [Alicyclobacillus tengchongensis]GLG01326.1 hypothetical protein Alches_13650 [Alicyclobacillus hesperidum subsp. aegles]
MAWKRAFIILLSINLLIVVAALIVWNTFPTKNQSTGGAPPLVASQQPAVEVQIGQEAINAYLSYAIAHDEEVGKILGSANVQFDHDWNCDFGIRLLGKIVPFHLVLTPKVTAGNLVLHVDSASMSFFPIPNSILFSVLERAHTPNWVEMNAGQDDVEIDFSKRPQRPFGIRMLNYSEATKKLALQLTISPQAVMPGNQ